MTEIYSSNIGDYGYYDQGRGLCVPPSPKTKPAAKVKSAERNYCQNIEFIPNPSPSIWAELDQSAGRINQYLSRNVNPYLESIPLALTGCTPSSSSGSSHQPDAASINQNASNPDAAPKYDLTVKYDIVHIADGIIPIWPDSNTGNEADALVFGGLDVGSNLDGIQNDLASGRDALTGPDLLALPDAAVPDVIRTDLTIAYDAGVMVDASTPDSLTKLDAEIMAPEANPDLTAAYDLGVAADSLGPDVLALDIGATFEIGQTIDGGLPLPVGYGPNSCPAYVSPEEKQFVNWPRLDSINDVPINVSPPNTDFFNPHPVLMSQARQGLSSMWNTLSIAGNEHWFDGIQRKGLMLFDISEYYVTARQSLGLEAYPFSTFEPDNGIMGYPTGAGFGDMGSACNEGVHIFYRLLHAPYEYMKTQDHEFVHWFGDQQQVGAPGVDRNSIDFTPSPSFSANNHCYSGTYYGESSNGEENRTEYVTHAIYFPSSKSILAEADQLLGCDASITATREDKYKQVYASYFNGLTPPAESTSVQNWLRVYLFNMRGLPTKALESAKTYIEANPNDAAGIKSIYYTQFFYQNPDTVSQMLPGVPYKGSVYTAPVYDISFPAEYSSLIDKIINNPTNPAGAPYAEEVIRYSLWYKAMMQAYPTNFIGISLSSKDWIEMPVYSESGLSAAQDTLRGLTERIGNDDHPLNGEVALLNALIGYRFRNKAIKTLTGIQFPAGGGVDAADAGNAAGLPATALSKIEGQTPTCLPVRKKNRVGN
jgi:hypothetical protein